MDVIKVNAKNIKKLLDGNGTWPKPDDFYPITWQTYLKSLQPDIEKAFKAGGVKIKDFNPKNAFREYFELKRGKDEFTIGLNDLASPKAIKGLHQVMGKIRGLMAVIDKICEKDGEHNFRQEKPKVYYEKINDVAKKMFKDYESVSLASDIIIDVLRQRGLSPVS